MFRIIGLRHARPVKLYKESQILPNPMAKGFWAMESGSTILRVKSRLKIGKKGSKFNYRARLGRPWRRVTFSWKTRQRYLMWVVSCAGTGKD